MSSPQKGKERKANGRKKRSAEQGPPRNGISKGDIVAVEEVQKGDNGNSHHNSAHAQPRSDDDLLKSEFAQKIISMVYNGASEEKLLQVVSLMLDEATVAEVEMLREEVQNLKLMLHDATAMLQKVAGKDDSDLGVVLDEKPVDWEQRLQKETYRLKKRLQEENKREMDQLRQYFEKQCSQSQSDYFSEIYALKLECQEVEQQRGEISQLRELCDHRNDLLQRLEEEHEAMMLEKRRREHDAVQLQAVLRRMEKEKLASEERTKKILSAVRDGLHKLSDMKSNPDGTPTAEGTGTREPGLSSFYNHVEEIITTDDWSDDDVYVKGVMEEIQVSVQKLARPVRTPDRTAPVEPEFVSMPSQTDFLPSTSSVEMDALKLSFEARISNLHDTATAEKQQYEQSLSDFQQQVDRLTQKTQADKRFIDELSGDRESEREEMLKLTQKLEEAWRDGDRQAERITLLATTSEELETQLKTATTLNTSLTVLRTRLQEDLQAKDELLRQREELVEELERRLSERDQQDAEHHKQMEMLQMELSGVLRTPPESPEPSLNESSFMNFDDLRQQISDLKDELRAKNQLQEKEREQRVHSLHTELTRVRQTEQRALRDCDALQQQIEQQDMEIAVLRQQVDDAKFHFVDEEVVEQLNSRIGYMQKEIEGCHRIIEQMESQLQATEADLQAARKLLDEKEKKLEQAGSLLSEDVIREKMEQFEARNQLLVHQMEETSAAWDQQQRAWEADMARKTDDVTRLQKQLSDSRDTSADFSHIQTELADTRKRLDQTEAIAQEKTVQVQSFRNLVDIMKSEAQQKDIAMKALQKQLNDNSTSLARQLEELERSNLSMRDEIDVYRNAPDRSLEVFEPLLRDKDAEISRLRELLEASLEESLSNVVQERNESSVQTEDDLVGQPVVPEMSFVGGADAEVQTEAGAGDPVVPGEGGGSSRRDLGLGDLEVTWRLNGFSGDGESHSRDSGNNSRTPEPESNLLSWHVPTGAASVSSVADSGTPLKSDSQPMLLELVDVQLQTDLENLESLLTQMASHKATIRELEHSLSQKELQIEAMALELASLSDRHGKTQTKHRTTIRYLNQSSSSDEGSTNSLPRANLNGDTKGLIERYEGKIREMEKVHTDEMALLVQESLSVIQNQSSIHLGASEKSSRDISPESADNSMMNDSTTLMETSLSDGLQKALRELRNGSNAVLKASMQLNGAPTGQKEVENSHDIWLQERDLLLGKIDFFRDTINQLVLSRDSMEMALRHMEQQNEDMKAEVEMLRKEDEMADQGKDLLLSLLKKTEAELAELHARYRQRDLRLEIEQAGREREEREREKLQRELRETEVQLVRVKGELRQKDAQWEREKILTMWKKESEETADSGRSLWRGRFLRAESYRKNLIQQKRYLATLLDDVIVNTDDAFVRQLALDGVRPTTTRRPPGSVPADRKKSSFRAIAAVVVAIHRLKTTRVKWQQVRSEIH
ncbi:hypothetical protein BV898_12579 [Hypsibius exemplaris]|uniref:Pericentrin/AKAP-450 centrosomal targeting domain-containing protein n=1 Tax=Hypsibius exemplaris TaxID=2072580 RepID=A0A1W0WDA4_HYPEX|nr:hypothetical protein BV898_12579 [Hypsibius exemplaris]